MRGRLGVGGDGAWPSISWWKAARDRPLAIVDLDAWIVTFLRDIKREEREHPDGNAVGWTMPRYR